MKPFGQRGTRDWDSRLRGTAACIRESSTTRPEIHLCRRPLYACSLQWEVRLWRKGKRRRMPFQLELSRSPDSATLVPWMTEPPSTKKDRTARPHEPRLDGDWPVAAAPLDAVGVGAPAVAVGREGAPLLPMNK